MIRLPAFVLIAFLCSTLGTSAPRGSEGPSRQSRAPRDGRILVRNAFGEVTVSGGAEKIEATAKTSDGRSTTVSIVDDPEQPGRKRIEPEAQRGSTISINVKVPHRVELDVITVNGSITVTDIDGAVSAATEIGRVNAERISSLKAVTTSGSVDARDVREIVAAETRDGNVQIYRAGSARVRTRSGNIVLSSLSGSVSVSSLSGNIRSTGAKGSLVAKCISGNMQIENSGGIVDIVGSNGNITVFRADRDVRAFSASGDITVSCVKGRAELGNASGSITIKSAAGDVDAQTAAGRIDFQGHIHAGGSYRMKAVSGEVRMAIQPDPPGFTATLSDYNGEIETAFPLKVESPVTGAVNRKLIGRYGDGNSRISLDTFSGAVRIIIDTSGETNECK